MVRIRVARLADARDFAGVQIAAWRAAYAGILPDDVLRGLDVDERSGRWAAALVEPEPPGPVRHLVAERRGRVVGIGEVGAPRVAVPDGTGELRMINVHPDWWGRGVAKPLFECLVAELAGLGYRSGYLWVVDGNDRARRFYERLGWRPDGTVRPDPRFSPPVPELRYVTDVLP
ncbi:MAG TPA: GNAT family N-acetyltransferase [Actinophytocola sp.]|uniref:GNAT family N-acetyltransferase n=1 Tax=Actinophytocola sp. TaxID=1872138 RepID=UPI002DB5571A|nr:GNAT family N-acetyltransferase [Actinophytocola sp.]HEU5471621.1 GNAT family N-acetyltransferase [Actinophytocola sp.]